MRIQHTRNMDEAGNILTKYARLLIRHSYSCEHQVLFKPKSLKRIDYFRQKHNGQDDELQRWAKHGGVLVYERGLQKGEILPDHDAQLVCELPLSHRDWALMTLHTKTLAVAYRPPDWDEHKALLGRRNPNGEVAARLDKFIRKGSVDPKLAAVLKIEAGPTVSDEMSGQAIGFGTSYLYHLRKAILPKPAYHRVQPIILRIKPAPSQGELRKVYEWIEANAPVYENRHLLLDNDLRGAHQFWRGPLARLHQGGYLVRCPLLCIYHLDRIRIDPARQELEHTTAALDFAELAKMIEESPELTTERKGGRPKRKAAA